MATPQPTAPSPQPPPELPADPKLSEMTSQYLRTFALWCRKMFQDKLDAHAALPGIMLSAYGTGSSNPPTYILGVNAAGIATLALMTPGTDEPPGAGTPIGGGSYLPLTGGTLTGALVGTTAFFSSTVQAANLVAQAPAGLWTNISLIAAAGQGKQIAFYTGDTAHPRWTIASSADAETGGNLGSVFGIARFNDAGTYLDSPFQITRNTGEVMVKGVVNGSNAAAGMVGEFLQNSAANVNMPTSGGYTNIVTLTLTPGDWDVCGSLYVIPTAGSTNIQGGISTTSGAAAQDVVFVSGANTSYYRFAIPTRRINVTVSTVVYLIGYAAFASGTCLGTGIIQARRMR